MHESKLNGKLIFSVCKIEASIFNSHINIEFQTCSFIRCITIDYLCMSSPVLDLQLLIYKENPLLERPKLLRKRFFGFPIGQQVREAHHVGGSTIK